MPDVPPYDRTPRLRDWSRLSGNSVQVARCRACGHLAALPVALLLQRYDALTPIELVRERITCSSCRSREIDIRVMRLCDPGCPRQRG
jgi:hypothetical protein